MTTHAIAPLALCAASTSLLGCTSNDSPKHDKVAPDATVEAAAPFPAPEPDDCFIADAQSARHCEGLDFRISVPDECITEPCGLITDVHGFGMNAVLMDRRRASAEQLLPVHPRAGGDGNPRRTDPDPLHPWSERRPGELFTGHGGA